MDRGRVGSLVCASKSCARKEWEKTHDAHRDRIKKVKPATDMTMPMTASLDHIRNNLKKEQLLEGRYMEIDRENRILLRKMSDMMKKPNPYTAKEAATRSAPSLNKDGRKQALLKLTQDNHKLLKKIQEVQPVYNHKKWEEHHKNSAVLLKNCCTYPVITRMARQRSSPSVLMRMETAGGDGTAAPMAVTESAAEDMKYVLKEGKRIGETYYLVEMSTDGRTLNISAYDGDTQTSLELVVGEKNHRQLYREVQGDYSLIASRLRVEGERLVLRRAE